MIVICQKLLIYCIGIWTLGCVECVTLPLHMMSGRLPFVMFTLVKIQNLLSDMCTHQRWIVNKYTKQRFLAKCGHCESCLQEKAASRSSRIRHEYSNDKLVVFGTLTYDRLSSPFIKYDDLVNANKCVDAVGIGYLPVYRHFDVKWNINKRKHIKNWSLCQLDSKTLNSRVDFHGVKFLKHRYGEIGVCFYPDYQDFVKRLRHHLERDFNYYGKFKIFNVSEYGEKSLRPHFHFLLFIPPEDFNMFREAVIKSWPYGNRIRLPESFQPVYDDPAGYVSSYVNCGSDFPQVFAKYFKPKYSASKFFGHGRDVFKLASLEEKISKGDLSYNLRRVSSAGEQVFNLPIPKYVINRWFPLFKGYSRLDGCEVFDILQHPTEYRIFDFAKRYDSLLDIQHARTKIDISLDDARKLSVRLTNCAKKWYSEHNRELPPVCTDYAIAFQQAWTCYKSCCYRRLLEDDSISLSEKYDNWVYLNDNRLCSFLHDNNLKHVYFNPNEFRFNINNTDRMKCMYNKYKKQKSITNYVLNEQGVLI